METPNPSFGEVVQAAVYFRRAMESRRSIEFRSFLIAAGFDLVVVKSFLDYPELRTQGFKGLAELAILVDFLLYVAMVVDIEKVSWRSREAYLTAENQILRHLTASAVAPAPAVAPVKQKGLQAASAAWAAKWPGLALAGICLACIALLYYM